MQQRKSSARQKAVSAESQQRGAAAQSGARAREVKAPPVPAVPTPRKLEIPAPPPSSSSGNGETTLGGHVDRGLTLAALYDTGVLERLRLEVRIRLLADLAQSLAWLHANPRLMAAHPHLIIAPSTVVIGLDGVARVDVRAAKKRESERNPLELDYVAPELANGNPNADLRADIYSLGVLAWEALTGRRLSQALASAAEARALGEPPPMSSDVPAALGGTGGDPLRRKSPAPAGVSSGNPALPPLLLPEEAGWAMPFATRVLSALSPERAERPQDCRVLIGELDLIAAHLASPQEIAEVVQGISAVATLCVPEPTLPDADAACQNEVGVGFMDREPCSNVSQNVCAQRQVRTVRRVAEPAPPRAAADTAPRQPAREIAAPPASAALQPRPTGKSSSQGAWIVAGLLTLAALGSLAGYAASLLAVH
jgi:hypothetical protein